MGRSVSTLSGVVVISTRAQHVLLIAPVVLVLILFLIGPIVLGLVASFTTYAPLQAGWRFVGFGNYARLLSDPDFRIALRNVSVFALIAVPAELAFGFGLAYLMRRPFAGRAVVRVLLLIPWLISPIANGVLWHFLLNSQVGIPNLIAAVFGLPLATSPLGSPALALPVLIAIDVWRKAPLAAFLLLPGLQALPAAWWELATLEGATTRQRIAHIALPALRPLLLTIALLLIGDVLGAFDTVLVLTGGGPGTATALPGLYSYQRAFQQNDWRIGSTSAWLIVIAVVLIGLAYMRLIRVEPQERRGR